MAEADRPIGELVLSAEFNAELERGRLIEGGRPAEQEPFLPPRDER